MTIRGKYEPKTQTIAIDLGSHLFKDTAPVTFHEMSHFWLAKYTNHGAVYSVLHEILLNPHELKADPKSLHKTAEILHISGYLPHEGFAHFMQAIKLFEDGGLEAVKDLEDHIPDEPKLALSYLRFAINGTDKFRNDITAKLSRLSMNTNLHADVLLDDGLIFDHDCLAKYLKDKNNLPNERYKALTQTIEKKPALLDLDDSEICLRSGINYYKPISNPEKANLINIFKAFTTRPTNLTESDIRVLSSPEEVFMPGFETTIIGNANILERAAVNHQEDFFLSGLRNFRTIFIFNGPETPVSEGKFGFFGFNGNSKVVNGRFDILRTKDLLANKELTKVVDTHAFDYEKNLMKPDRGFVGANIIWYKHFRDFEIFIEMMKKLKLKVQANYVAFTDKHNFWFYIFRTSDNHKLLHILTSFPFVASRLEEQKNECQIQKVDFFDLISGNEIHLNNFFHDILGVPYQLNAVEMARDAEKYLDYARQKIKLGISPYEVCICGSERKYKWCHKG